MGEFDFIGRLRKAFPDIGADALGIGDDCAVIRFSSGGFSSGDPACGTSGAAGLTPGSELLVSTDLLLEGVHFLLDAITPWQLGWKAAAVNLSDIAAMGGRPRWTFLSIALPKGEAASRKGIPPIDAAWADAFIAGYKAVSDRFGVKLLGGDTSASLRDLCINVAVLGECPAGKAVLRSAARPGDLICVSGTLGDSAAGLRLSIPQGKGLRSKEPIPQGFGLSESEARIQYLLKSHFEPVPRVELGQELREMRGMGAMMDLSDGLASDVRHILKASGEATGGELGAEIDVSSLPLSDELKAVCKEKGWDPVSLALEGGEDYELLFTCRPDAVLPRYFDTPLSETPSGDGCAPVPLTVVGRVTDTPGVVWKGSERDYHGFTHF
ncbi:MAG: thiamine-phosphate kinase [Bacteroidales bacterium]|nr:thiamine-phosphate kinase [Bacteroidales bacterium]